MEQREDKEDGVCPSASTLRHQHEGQSKVQRKPEPESSPTAESEAESGYSGWSFRSDWSKDIITDFKSGQPSAVRSPVGPDSPLSVHSYPSCGTNRSKDTDLDFNNQGPTPPESYRRTYEELLQHQQEVIRQQEALLRRQEVQRQQEVQLHQQEVQHLQKVIRQQEIQLQGERKAKQEALEAKQEALEAKQEAKQEAQEAKREAQEAKQQLKLKCLEDQQHFKSGKNHSHESKRKHPELTPSLPDIDISDPIGSLFEAKQKHPEMTPSLPVFNFLDLISSPFDYKQESTGWTRLPPDIRKLPRYTPAPSAINKSDHIYTPALQQTLTESVSSSSEVESLDSSED